MRQEDAPLKTKKLARSIYTSCLSPAFAPALDVRAGEKFVLEAPSALGGVIRRDGKPSVKPAFPNPFSGPVRIAGIRAGETIGVRIYAIKAVGYGFAGGLIYRTRGARIHHGGFHVPYDPSLGCLGVAPGDEKQVTDSMSTAAHGGNIDCRDFAPGAVVFFKARVDGALLGAGDVHLAMGDGEVEGQGIESAADVTLSVRAFTGAGIENPWLVRRGEIMAIGFDENLSQAIRCAYEQFVLLCGKLFGKSRKQIQARMRPSGHVRICQSCCRIKTVRVSLPLRLFGYTEKSFLRKFLRRT
jgi:acetamidase/formamidase